MKPIFQTRDESKPCGESLSTINRPTHSISDKPLSEIIDKPLSEIIDKLQVKKKEDKTLKNRNAPVMISHG